MIGPIDQLVWINIQSLQKQGGKWYETLPDMGVKTVVAIISHYKNIVFWNALHRWKYFVTVSNLT